MIPDFLICGAQKAGTSSLRAFLSQHPQIFMPITEVHYYDWNYDKGQSWYHSFFKEAKTSQIVGEKSTDYMYQPFVAKRIYDDNPDVKLIFLLRNPIKRIHSQYRMDFATMKTHRSFEETVLSNSDMIDRGFYDKQLNYFYKYFKPEQMLIFISEDFKQNKKQILKDVLGFLNVDTSFVFPDLNDRNKSVTTNSWMVRKLMKTHDRFFGSTNNPYLKKTFKHMRKLLVNHTKDNKRTNYPIDSLLYSYYKDTIVNVEKIIGRRIPQWHNNKTISVKTFNNHITVVITHYQDYRLFCCINSLINQVIKPDSILIADGGSSTDFIKEIQGYIKPYNHIQLKSYPGRCIDTRRQLIDDIVDSTDIIVWVDSDMIVFPDWLYNLVSPIVYNLVDFVGGTSIPFNCHHLLKVIEQKPTIDSSYIAMGNSAWNTKVFKKIGTFDNGNVSINTDLDKIRGSYHISDDFDINLRAINNGFIGIIVDDAYVLHNQNHIHSFNSMLSYLYGQYVRTSMAYFKHKQSTSKFTNASKNIVHPFELFLLLIKMLALVRGWREWNKINS